MITVNTAVQFHITIEDTALKTQSIHS